MALSTDRVSTSQNSIRVIVVCGLDFEAKIAAGPNVTVVYGLDREKLARNLDRELSLGAAGVLSFGTSGGLSPNVAPGTVVVPSAVVSRVRGGSPDLRDPGKSADGIADGDGAPNDDGGRTHPAGSAVSTEGGSGTLHVWPSDPAWTSAIRKQLSTEALAENALLYADGTAALSVAAKHALHHDTQAAAIDMESHMVAQAAQRHGTPFAVLRVVLDPATRTIPQSAMRGARPDGTTNALAVVGSLALRPWDLPALLRLAVDTGKARGALLRCRERLGPLLGLADAGHLPLDMQ